MELILLKSDSIQATFDPERGMNLLSFKRDEIEVIDQSTRPLFEERSAGLGALIGPHFHHRKVIPPVKEENLFPHIARVKAKGVHEPFSHGIARYAPWKVLQASSQKISARLTGKDLWNGVALAALEGQNFAMQFEAEVTENQLKLDLSVVSDSDSLVGIHYYYALPRGRGTIYSQVQEPSHSLQLELNEAVDRTFLPFPNPLKAEILLDAVDYKLKTQYFCECQENSWQLYHPAGASFVCIEPISSQDPRHPNLTVSQLTILLEILK